MSFVNDKIAPAHQKKVNVGEIYKIFGKVKKPRRCHGVKFSFDFTNGIGISRCFSRDTRIVRIVKKLTKIDLNETDIPEEMMVELDAIKLLKDDGDITEETYKQFESQIRSVYNQRGVNLDYLKTYSGEVKHFCDRCKKTYLAKNPDREAHMLDLKLQ